MTSAAGAADADEFAAWLRLLETPGIGRGGARRLLAAFGSPMAVFDAPPAALKTVVDTACALALGEWPPEFRQRLDAARAWLDGGPARHVITLGDAAYPSRLLQTADPPLVLYVEGDVQLMSAPSVAVVGSRAPTPQGLANAREFALQLSRRGLVVVSGLALGVDGAAHAGALEGLARGGGATVAVVGTGLDITYPKRHAALAARIAAGGGALVSEFAPGTPALPEHFPLRNRIIASMTLGTLVVEAALKSGSLITARLAVEAGREVFAIPGSIHSAQSHGCHALIRQGAALVESADEVADLLLSMAPRKAAAQGASEVPAQDAGDAPADPLLDALGHDPTHLDALQARTGWPTAELLARLLELELEGRVARLPGGLYQQLAAT